MNVDLGGKKVNYIAPGYVKRQWNHIALVRTAADVSGKFTFKLYLNGVLLSPVGGVEISFSPTDPMSPSQVPQGELRLGRRTSGLNLESSKSWQFYGLIDEVAVFDSALSQANISQIMQCGFGGDESAMVAGMTFDTYGLQTPPGPKIVTPVTPVAPVSNFVQRLTVASGVKSANAGDADLFEGPHVAPTQGSYQLPFPAGEVWQVQQAPDSAGGSHNGFAAFSWDFKRVVAPMQGTVSAAASGQIYYVKEGVVLPADVTEANAVRINVAPNESVLYLHLEPFSFTDIFMDGNPFFAPQTGPVYYLPVTQGDDLAKSGMNAAHLHFDGNDGALGVNSGGVTMPIGFSDYEVLDFVGPNQQQWHTVLRGMPKAGEIIRRM
nr:LamG-like jellyroll fold domain-containing protein [Nannocystis pusilla]